MKKLFQNKFFLICVCIAVVLCAVPSTLAIMGYRGLSKNIVGTVTVPFRWCVTVVGNAFEGFGRYFSSIDAMQAKNEELQSENQALREQIEAAEQLERENERLREYLDIKAKNPTFEMKDGNNRILRGKGTIFMDCGLGRGGRLGCLRLDDGEEFYVE